MERTPTQRRSVARSARVAALVGVIAVGAMAGAQAARADVEHRVSVGARRGWTDTGVDVHAGETAQISATGTVQFRARAARVTAAGVPWGATCDRLEQPARVTRSWPAPGVNCWSLIGRVGTGKPFAIGSATGVRVPESGRLSLGINDNYLDDNAGAWSVRFSVSAAAAASAPAHDNESSPAHHSNGGSAVFLGLLALLVGAALVVVLVLLRRRRNARDEETDAPVGGAGVALSAAAMAGDETQRLAPTDDDHTVVPDESDAAHVNIFEVELTTDALRVGYNQFPEGVAVEWTVREGLSTRARGSFVTNGGGETEHYVSFRLELPPAGERTTMSVHFRWTIGEVPFTYSVQRAPRAYERDADAPVD